MPTTNLFVTSFATAVIACMCASVAHGGGPSNDTCATARLVELGAHSFTNVDANVAAPGVCATIGRDVWFKFESTFQGRLLASTCGDADFDTVIAAYDGCSCGGFQSLGCNNDGLSCDNGTSRLIIDVEAGQCYLIRVAGFNGDSGSGVLTLSCADEESAACADIILTGFDPGDQFGVAVAGGGRINGDQEDDVVIGAERTDFLGLNAGRAYARRGPNLGGLFTKTGEGTGDNFGSAVAVGDVNSDGRLDIIVGAPRNDEAGANAGRVYVYSGFNNALLWTQEGEAAGDLYGFSVAYAGDVNDDGFGDVIVGAPLNDARGPNAGRAYVLDGEDGSLLRRLTGQEAGDRFGSAVAGVGDVNDDDRDDYAIGAPQHDEAGSNSGRVTIYSGANGSVFKRFDGDEPGDLFGSAIAGGRFLFSSLDYGFLAVGSPGNDTIASNAGRVKLFYRNIDDPSASGCGGFYCIQYTINGSNQGDAFGAAIDLQDVVNSVTADIIIGAPKADFAGSNSGAVYIFDGGSGTLTHRYFGEAPGDQFGSALSGAGDIDNDDEGDIIVGAPFNDAGGTNAGRAYAFLLTGSAQGKRLAAPGLILPGDPRIDIAVSGDVNADGVSDVNDVLAVIAAWGACAGKCPADLTGDGMVDDADLAVVIDAW